IRRDGRDVTLEQSSAAGETLPAAPPSRPIRVGDRVRLRSFGSEGIVDQLNGDEAEVRVKSLRFREKIDNLDLLGTPTPVQPETGRLRRLQQAARSSEVNLRAPDDDALLAELNVIGRRADEAVDATDKFLDEAFMNSMNHVRIVHGHGTGALRRAIADLLRGHPHVARFAQAPQDQGGAGATIVELRQ
ncbi:MAG: Smr/MutS family protein, partial [Pyrinomonadaceae bacterium]